MPRGPGPASTPAPTPAQYRGHTGVGTAIQSLTNQVSRNHGHHYEAQNSDASVRRVRFVVADQQA